MADTDSPTGVCSVCGQTRPLRASGTIKMHLLPRGQHPRGTGRWETVWCPGGYPPHIGAPVRHG